MRPLSFVSFVPLLALVTACEGGDPFPMPPATSPGTGPRISWDLGHRPLPEIPLPNDIATWPDPNSPTGLRVNASLLSPTGLESAFRAQFDELDGWGTYQAITIPFGDDLDLATIIRHHQHDDFRFPDDTIYLVDLGPNDPSIQPGNPEYGHPGLPMPIDIGEGNYQFTRRARDPLFANDPRAGESNIILETINEDTNHDGRLQAYEDTNFDGVLGRASIYPAGGNAYDNLTGFYEASTHTLIIRPLLPLLENHRYAVVVTDRLVGTDGQPVRSPFAGITHPSQLESLEPLQNDLQAHPEIYGDLRWSRSPNDPETASHVAFTWRYTTQTTVSEWFHVRDGLYGRGPFASLQSIQPQLTPADITVGSTTCTTDQRSHPFVMRHTPEDRAHDPFQKLFELIWSLDDPGEQRRESQYASYDNVAYLVAGTFHSPYLMNSDPRGDANPQAHWQLNSRTGEVRHVGDAEIPFILIVPRSDAQHHAPFPLAYYLHGYGAGITEVFTTAGVLAQNGIATIAIDGPTHGLPLDPRLTSSIRTTLRGACQLGIGETLLRTNRARDLNGSGIQDPAGDFWCAYVPHSRDNVRQYALEISQLVRGVRGWDGQALAGVDLNNNGNANDDIGGDFDGDGMPDVGSGSNMYAIGESLGGIMSMMVGGSEPHIRGAIPYAGGGGLSDVAIRSSQGGIKEAVYLRLMGPLVVGIPASEYGEQDYGSCTTRLNCEPYSECRVPAGGGTGRCHRTRTACAADQISLRILSTDVTDVGELEFACATLNNTLPQGSDPHVAATLHPGDDILVENVVNHSIRCGRVSADGRFRVGIPSDTGDHLRILVYPAVIGPGGAGTISAVEDFGTCQLSAQYLASANGPSRPGMSGSSSVSIIDTFKVVEGDCTRGCGHVPVEGLIPCQTPEQTDCDPNFVPGYMRITQRETALVSPAEGLGLRRQSPEFRRFLILAQAALDKGDPISFAPYYFLRPSPTFEPPTRHATIVTNTVGDQNVPLNSGNAFSRAAGLIPFLPADAPDHLREYRTPQTLEMRYGRTPNRLLIDRWVLEGISFLNRWPVPNDPGALFDVDNLDEGLAMFGEQTEDPPLRLVRLARPMANANDLDTVWAPTIGSAPWTATDDQPLAATMNYYVEPHGHHSVDNPPRPDLAWDYSTYAYNLAGRFFQTDGTDVYYRTHPTMHLCLETGSCPHNAH